MKWHSSDFQICLASTIHCTLGTEAICHSSHFIAHYRRTTDRKIWKFMSKCAASNLRFVRTLPSPEYPPGKKRKRKLIPRIWRMQRQIQIDTKFCCRFSFDEHLNSTAAASTESISLFRFACYDLPHGPNMTRTTQRHPRWRPLQLVSLLPFSSPLWSTHTNTHEPNWNGRLSERVSRYRCQWHSISSIGLHNAIARVAKWYALIHGHAHTHARWKEPLFDDDVWCGWASARAR